MHALSLEFDENKPADDIAASTRPSRSRLHRWRHASTNTPVHPLSMVINGRQRTVHLKLEDHNPGGSVKYRTAVSLIEDLEERGLLDSHPTLIESSSGNLAVALAMIAQIRGLRFIAVIDPKTTQENINLIQQYGAQVVRVEQPDDSGGYLLRRLATIERMLETHNNLVWTNQYANPSNPRIHYLHTAPEAYAQMSQRIDAFFASVSTGGTLAGMASYLREVSPSTHIVAVDAMGSVALHGQPGPRKLTGLGSSQPSRFLTPAMYDSSELVTDGEAFSLCRQVAVKTGLKLGGSSAAALAACVRLLAREPDLDRAICVCPDGGDRYAASIYNDAWLKEHSLWPLSSELDDIVDDILPARR